MASICDQHDRIRLFPKNKEALIKLRDKLQITVSIPALANDMIERGILTMDKKKTTK